MIIIHHNLSRFGKPARCVLSRKTDMIMSGKREPYAANYQIGFTSTGNLLAVKMYIYSNAGCSLDASFVVIFFKFIEIFLWNCFSYFIYG